MAVPIESLIELKAWTPLLRGLPIGDTVIPPITYADFESLGTVAYRENKRQDERIYRLSGKNLTTNELTISVSLKHKRRRKKE